MSAAVRARRVASPREESDDFASVLHPATAASSTAAAAARRTQLSDQQLYDRIEEQLEQLDKKRLLLQQLLRSWRDTPYSSRVSRSVESTRVDSARLAKKIHNLFKFMQPRATHSSEEAAIASDETVNKFQPLFQNYAAVSRLLNAACMESVAFEEEIAKGARRTSNADANGRRRLGVSAYDPAGEPRPSASASSSSSSSYSSVGDLESDSLPRLQVHGLESYEESKKQGEYMNLQTMVGDIAHSFHALQSIAASQQERLDDTEARIDAAKLKTDIAESDIRQASRYKAFGLVMAGGVTGAAIGGPLGALVGLKTGLSIGVGAGLVGAGGAIIGAAAGKKLQRARFVPVSHEAEERELLNLTERDRAVQSSHRASPASDTSSAASSIDYSPPQSERGTRRQ